MNEKSRIIAMIPARIGSTRLKMKNLALIGGKPMIAYSILAAKKSEIFDRIVINSDSNLFKKIAESYDVEFYKRPDSLGSDKTKSDDVVFDFIQENLTEVLVWVNPICPLQNGDEIKEVVHYFIDKKLDSLITVKEEQVHCVYEKEPVNFSFEGKFAQTQDLTPVYPFVYSIMIWRTQPFLDAMKKNGSAFFAGKFGFYPVSKLASFVVKRKEDLQFADFFMRATSSNSESIMYDELVQDQLK